MGLRAWDRARRLIDSCNSGTKCQPRAGCVWMRNSYSAVVGFQHLKRRAAPATVPSPNSPHKL